MYLEVSAKNKKIVYDIHNKTEIIIGSLHTCDLILSDPSVSRKHAKIFYTEGKWFVADQGSTNGTHLDGKQIIPGQRQEIGFETPVRLGHKVEVSLLTEGKDAQPLYSSVNFFGDGKKEKKDDKTRVISLAQLKAAQDAADKKKLKKKQEKRLFEMKAKKAEKQRTIRTLVIVLVVLLAGVIGNQLWKKRKEANRKEGIIKKMQSKKGASDDIEAEIEGVRIVRSELLSRNSIINYLNGPKCQTENEKELCDRLSFLTLGHNGLVRPKTDVVLAMLEEEPWLKRVNGLLEKRSGVDRQSKYKIAFLLILKEYFSDIQNGLEENPNFYISFYTVSDTGLVLSGTGAIKWTHVTELVQKYNESSFSDPKIPISDVMEELNLYFTYY